MKVKDVMSRRVEYVSVDTPVEDVAQLLFGRAINGVPVCKGKKVVGFITEKDILRRFYPTIKDYLDDRVKSTDFQDVETKVEEVLSLKAKDIMSHNPTTITPDTPILKAQSTMLTKKIGRLPVTSDKGRLLGIIAKGDIFNALVGDKILFKENQDYNDWLSKTYYQSVDIEGRMKHEMPDLLNIFKKHNVKTVLDIGSGTGDHLIELAKKGFICVGTDRSSAMINEAERRAKELNKKELARLQFHTGETEKILPKLDSKFDAVLFMGNTLSHNPHVYKKLLKLGSEKLTEDGVLILQITNFTKIVKAHKRLLSFNFSQVKNGTTTEYAFLEFYGLPDAKDETILKTFAVLESDDKRWKSSGVRNSLFAYTDQEILKKVLKEAGFSKITFYGGSFDGKNWDYLFRKPFKPLESDWLNVVAER